MNRLPAILSVTIGLPLLLGATLLILLATGMDTLESRRTPAAVAVTFFAVQAAIASILLSKKKYLHTIFVVWGPVGIAIATMDLASLLTRIVK